MCGAEHPYPFDRIAPILGHTAHAHSICHGLGLGEAFLEILEILKRGLPPFHVLPPGVFTSTAPTPFLDVDHIVPQRLHTAADIGLQRIHHSVDQDNGEDAYRDAQKAQKGAELIDEQRVQCERHTFGKSIEPNAHVNPDIPAN